MSSATIGIENTPDFVGFTKAGMGIVRRLRPEINRDINAFKSAIVAISMRLALIEAKTGPSVVGKAAKISFDVLGAGNETVGQPNHTARLDALPTPKEPVGFRLVSNKPKPEMK